MSSIEIRTIIWTCALTAGAVFFLLISVWGKALKDKGFYSFLFTLVPGFIYASVELVFLLLSSDISARGQRILRLVESGVFLSLGLSCVLFYKAQYRYNNVSLTNLLPFSLFAFVTAGNYLVFVLGIVFSGAESYSFLITNIVVYLTLSYAGVSTIYLLRFTNKLSLSSWAGMLSAGLGLVYFPFIIISDFFQLTLPFTDTERPVRLQAYAVYYLLVCGIVISFLLASRFSVIPSKVGSLPSFTRREEEFIDLLCYSLSNKEIAERLSISLATVKTHTMNIYRKTGVHSRSELRDVRQKRVTRG